MFYSVDSWSLLTYYYTRQIVLNNSLVGFWSEWSECETVNSNDLCGEGVRKRHCISGECAGNNTEMCSVGGFVILFMLHQVEKVARIFVILQVKYLYIIFYRVFW